MTACGQQQHNNIPSTEERLNEWQTVQDWAASSKRNRSSLRVGMAIYWKTKNEVLLESDFKSWCIRQTTIRWSRSREYKGTGSDVSYVRAPPGRYYLQIYSANVDWLVRVEGPADFVRPPTPPPSAMEISAELDMAAKQEAPNKKMTEQQYRAALVATSIGGYIESKMIVTMSEDYRAIYVDGDRWRTLDAVDTDKWRKGDVTEGFVRLLADFRQAKNGASDIVIYDSLTERELASYTPLRGMRHRR